IERAITNYYAFRHRERMEVSKTGRALLQGHGPEPHTLETEGERFDASGRAGLTCDLLAVVGLPQPDTTLIGVDIGYATAVLAISDHAPAHWKAVLRMPQAPESSRGALLLPLEGRER
ncbi:MAG: hypothetical protein JO122_09850, partial [Acetobacteraceae bacterium]|nr:hypothetical protein [Acetobacteraceae bacterium]